MPKRLGFFLVLCLSVAIFTSCDDDEQDDAPPMANLSEEINEASVIFTDTNGATVTARVVDADGEGPANAEILGDINLQANTTYTLSFSLMNTLGTTPEDIAEEVAEEDDEHQFFFSFTNGAFSDPTGSGNIESAAADLNYADMDDNGRPVGLSTTWTTGDALSDGSFRVLLQHQPDGIKTDTSGSSDGDTDIDVTFTLNIN